MLTAQKLALRLLRYIGISRFAAQAAGSDLDSYSASDGEDLAACINAGLQELFSKAGPNFLNAVPWSIDVPGPLAVTFTATAGSKVISAASPSVAFVQGATLRVTGDPLDNEVVSPTALLRTHRGPSGPNIATLYGDAVPLDASIMAVHKPVWLNTIRELLIAATYDELLRWDLSLVRFEPGINLASLIATPRSVGIPIGCMVDTFYSMTAAPGLALRIVPLPDRDYRLRFSARIGPRVITPADFASDTDPNTTFGLPPGFDESVLFPICLQRWTGNPLFKNQSVKDEIVRQYKMAFEILHGRDPNAGKQLHIQSGF